MTRRSIIITLALAAACGASEATPKKKSPAPVEPPGAQVEVGYFAGGCFWGVEHFLEQIPGVYQVESGYMGGKKDAPTYDDVSSGATGHAETVRVRFDPQKTSYEAVAKRFFEIHDPTEVDRQGPDVGAQYRSAVFVTGPEQRAVIETLLARLKAGGYAVATTVHDAGPFFLAEDYHQDYYARTHKTPYCHAPVPRFDRPAAGR